MIFQRWVPFARYARPNCVCREDVSVVGFDDIQSAAYQNPALTTVRQPLREMGRIAAETLLRRIRRPGADSRGAEIMVEPKLIVRQTTSRVLNRTRRSK